jgi:hypothetical protein
VLPHDRNLNKFGCSGEQLSSLIPTRPKFFGTAEPCPPEKPSAIRHLLLAAVLAQQEPRPPIFLVPRPTPLVPLKVSTYALRHQLRAKAHSMDCFSATINLWLEAVSMVCFV